MGFVVGFLWLAAALAVPPKGLRVNRALRTTHSRRECNRFIAEGRLLVNGITAVNPDDRLAPGDQVQLDGEEVAWMEDEIEPHRYIKFNKPAGCVCTTDRRVPGNINDAFESFVGGGSSKHGNATATATATATRRVYPIGRLDAESTGIILLTSDGSIVNPLLRAGEKKVKEYHVMTEPCATDAHILQLAAGIVITTKARKDGGFADVTAKTLPCTVQRICIDATTGTGTRAALRFVLGEGRNRQIRRMCTAVGIEVTSLHRVGFVGVSLQGCENAGDWATLTEAEELTIGARKGPTRNELRTPEERARRKAKKLAKKHLK